MSIRSFRLHGYSLLKLAALCLCLMVAAPPAAAKGEFLVRNAVAFERDGVYYINASIDYELNDFAIEALESGVALTFEVRLEVERSRRWRPDKEVAELLQLYELQFHALSERYIVRNLNSGEQNTYLTLGGALGALGQIENLPLLDAALLKPERIYEVRLKAVLDIRSFPGPLRLVSAFFGDWRLASRWYEWRLTP